VFVTVQRADTRDVTEHAYEIGQLDRGVVAL
jgi:hypothetical protein